MLLTLEVLPAKEGDCLILHWKTKAGQPKIAVIDGGPSTVYEDSLYPRLQEIAAGGKLFLDLVMVSHVDNDHIVGIKKMFEGMHAEIEGGTAPKDRLLKIGRLWHNTFNDIVGDAQDAYYKGVTATFTATANGQVEPAVEQIVATQLRQKGLSEEEAEHAAEDVAAVLAGHGESRGLRDFHDYLEGKSAIKFPINSPFKKDSKPTLITGPQKNSILIEDLHLAVYGPMQPEIDGLQKAFDKYLKEKKLTAEAALAAYADESIPNLSSLVVLAGVESATGERKTLLLTGDARGDKIIEGLEQAGVLNEAPLFVNVLKVPHHGSDRNVEPNFFKRIVADVYVLSADGKHGNPDRDTLEWIVESRPKTAVYDIVLTYPVKEIDKIRKAVHNQKQKEREKKGQKPIPWSQKKMALEVFFEEAAASGYNFNLRVGDGTKPVTVQLGDE